MNIDSPGQSAAMHSERLFNVEMRISILRTKLRDAEHERDTRRKRRQPTRMIETIIDIIAGDLDRSTQHRAALLAMREPDTAG
jgi:hypothetical protein